MPGTRHILDRIPQHTTDTDVPTGAIPMVQADDSVVWEPLLASQVEGNVPRVDASGDVVWERALGPQAAAIADPSGGTTVDTEARTAIVAILTLLRAGKAIAP